MPWYWSDEVAPILLGDGSIDESAAAALTDTPIAFRSEYETIEEAATELAEDVETPLAA